MDIFIYLLVSLAALIGLAGTILPLLPGTTLILVSTIGLKIFIPSAIEWSTTSLVFGLWIASVLVDFFGVALGARLGGGGKWAISGASVGALVGLFWSLPGILLGSFLGATLAEKIGTDKSDWQNLRAGVGAGLGYILATVIRFFLALTMVMVVVISVWRHLT